MCLVLKHRERGGSRHSGGCRKGTHRRSFFSELFEFAAILFARVCSLIPPIWPVGSWRLLTVASITTRRPLNAVQYDRERIVLKEKEKKTGHNHATVTLPWKTPMSSMVSFKFIHFFAVSYHCKIKSCTLRDKKKKKR